MMTSVMADHHWSDSAHWLFVLSWIVLFLMQRWLSTTPMAHVHHEWIQPQFDSSQYLYVLESIAHGQQLKWTLNTGLHASDVGIGYGQPVLPVATAQVTM